MPKHERRRRQACAGGLRVGGVGELGERVQRVREQPALHRAHDLAAQRPHLGQPLLLLLLPQNQRVEPLELPRGGGGARG